MILIEIAVFEFSFEVVGNNPVAVVERETETEFDDSENVVVVQSVNGKYPVDEFAVPRDDAGFEPGEQTVAGQSQPDRKKLFALRVYFQNGAVEPVQGRRL